MPIEVARLVESLIQSFQTPHKVSAQPTYEELVELRKIIYVNAASVQSTNGGGNYGHLGVTMSLTDYAT